MSQTKCNCADQPTCLPLSWAFSLESTLEVLKLSLRTAARSPRDLEDSGLRQGFMLSSGYRFKATSQAAAPSGVLARPAASTLSSVSLTWTSLVICSRA